MTPKFKVGDFVYVIDDSGESVTGQVTSIVIIYSAVEDKMCQLLTINSNHREWARDCRKLTKLEKALK